MILENAETIPRCLNCGERDSELWASMSDVEYFSLDGKFCFYLCHACGVLYIDPCPNDKLTEIYPENYYSFGHTLDSPVYRIKQWLDRRLLRKILRDIPGETVSALDIGGGTGWQLNLVRKIDSRINFTQVVDIADKAECQAKQHGHEYFQGRVEDFKTDRKFDLILMLNLIEHVDNPLAVLKQVRGLLSTHGTALLKTPNFDSLDARIFRHANWSGYHCPRHWVLFSKESFKKTAAKAGLGVKMINYTQGAPFWSGSVLNALSKRGLIRVSKDRPMLSHPLLTPMFAIFAAFDFIRLPFSKTSQMFIIVEKSRLL